MAATTPYTRKGLAFPVRSHVLAPCRACRIALAVLAAMCGTPQIADAELLLTLVRDVDDVYRQAYWELETVLGD